jgi:hypothetical protein
MRPVLCIYLRFSMSKSLKSFLIIGKTEVAFLHIGPAWAHVVRACLSHNFLLPVQIMNTIGGFTPGTYKNALHYKQDPIDVFPYMKLGSLVPNFHIHVSVSDLHLFSPTIG